MRPMCPLRHATALLILPLVFAGAAQADSGTTTSRSLNADGSTSMRYEQQLADLAQVGVNLSTEASSVVPTSVAGTQTVSGGAFAKVSVNDLPNWLLWQKGAVNVAVSPTDESKLGTTLSRSWTLYEGLKAELSDSYALARSSSGSGAWQTDKALSLKLTETGTTVSVAASASEATPQLLPSISAQQKVFGALNVTTTVADTGSELNKSITAGFSHRW